MSKAELAQVIDREALDASCGARGRLRLDIPAGWARDGGDIEITVPIRIACARCEGGGCDGCERSGAHRAPGDPAARTLRMRLPACFDGSVQLRLVRPFGEEAPIEQLLIEISAGNCTSPGIVWLPALPLDTPARHAGARRRAAVVLGFLAALAAVIGLLASR